MKNIAILGSTGSVGRQALDILRENRDLCRVFAITGNNNIVLLKEQIAEFCPRYAAAPLKNADLAEFAVQYNTEVLFGEQGLCDIASLHEVDTVLSAIVGIAGLAPTYAAVKSRKTVALANKETLVAAGDIIMTQARKSGAKIIAVDSEHSAVAACLCDNKPIKKIHLTASGGTFYGKTRAELEHVTAKDALSHPNWSMGAKITADSATLANKALEVIEAHYLFDMDYDKINVVIHLESIIHSMVEYIDNSIIAQLAVPDMRLPISAALFSPETHADVIPPLDFAKLKSLTFDAPNIDTFRMLPMGIEAGRKGMGYPIVYNAANEVAVGKFLRGEIGFLQIEEIVQNALDDYVPREVKTIEDVFEIDTKIRRRICQQL